MLIRRSNSNSSLWIHAALNANATETRVKECIVWWQREWIKVRQRSPNYAIEWDGDDFNKYTNSTRIHAKRMFGIEMYGPTNWIIENDMKSEEWRRAKNRKTANNHFEASMWCVICSDRGVRCFCMMGQAKRSVLGKFAECVWYACISYVLRAFLTVSSHLFCSYSEIHLLQGRRKVNATALLFS